MIPDAIIAVNDSTAIGAFQRIKEAGLRIPDAIAIAGFSNNKIKGCINPVMKRDRRVLCGVFALLVALLSISWAQSSRGPSLDTLAVVGKKVITSEGFARLYEEKLLRLGLGDNGETWRGYLRNLVDDEILIAQAKRKKLDRTKESLAELARIQLQELLNAYSETHISSTIEVTDDDLRELFLKMNTKIKVRHLYARTKVEADSLYDELSKGRSFIELAQRVFTDPRLKDNGGSLGYISIDEMDPDFERAAYRMNVDEISKPVKTVQGYSVIKVDDIKRNPFVTESEFQKAKERLRGLARKRRYEEAVKQYSTALRTSLHIQFNDVFIARLHEMTQQRSLQRLIEDRTLSISPEDLKKPVVTWTIGTWRVCDLIDALSQTTEQQRTWIRTKENFEDFIVGLVMRRYISQEAKKEKLNVTSSYRKNVDHAFGTYLLTTLEGQLKQQIKFSPDSLKSYYVQNKDRFTTQPQIRLSAILVDNTILADSIQQLLERGTPFDQLAKRFSIQRLTAEYGGDLGYYRKEELGTLGEDLFALNPGQRKGPIAEEGKYLFLKCTDLKRATHRPFEECSKEIEDLLVSLTWFDARGRYVDSFKKEIPCRMYPERLAAIPLLLFNR